MHIDAQTLELLTVKSVSWGEKCTYNAISKVILEAVFKLGTLLKAINTKDVCEFEAHQPTNATNDHVYCFQSKGHCDLDLRLHWSMFNVFE